MTVLPFICLGIGILLGIFVNVSWLAEIAEKVSTAALAILMFAIGLGIGIDKETLSRFPSIGFHCIVIALSAIGFSILFTVLCEKTVLPLKAIDKELNEKQLSLSSTTEKTEGEEKQISHLVWIMPCGIIAGLLVGITIPMPSGETFIDMVFAASLIILYICVGISQGKNREVFQFVRILGFRVMWLSAAILLGSVAGGIFAGLILKLPMHISVVSASGMSFYSITGAYMTQAFGLQTGTYGFIVNVLREFFTVLLMPLLIKISLGSPIAGGAAGNMDTMLAPVTKFVGVRLGLVTLITGTILTFLVPLLLPVIAELFSIV